VPVSKKSKTSTASQPIQKSETSRKAKVSGTAKRKGITSESESKALCFKLCEILEIPPATARDLLLDPECQDEDGNPEVNRALALFWKRQAHMERAYRQEQHEEQMRQANAAEHVAAGKSEPSKKSGSFTQTLDVPDDWDVGPSPKGGLHYSTFRRKLIEVQRYNRKSGEDGPKITLKSLVHDDLKAGLEGRCGLDKHCWNSETAAKHPGLSEEEFLNAIRKSLKPARKSDYKQQLENMKLSDRGQKGYVLLEALTTWGIKWLAKLREAEEADVKLNQNWLKLVFKEALDIAPFKKWLKGRSWPKSNGSSIWYRYLCDKLKKKASHAEEDSREAGQTFPGTQGNYYRGKRMEPAGQSYPSTNYQTGTNNYRAGGGTPNPKEDTHRPSDERRRYVDFKEHSADGEKFWQHHQHHEREASFDNHSGGVEPMQYRREEGKHHGRGGGAARGNYQGQAGLFRERAPVNDPARENVSILVKGKWWHDSADLSCCCKNTDCGAKQEVPFCQGCGQHQHSREYCYKRNDSRFNPTGYWCENRKGQPPIPSLGGGYPGSPTKEGFGQQPRIPPPAKLNASDARGL
jgi:hypothetical protein